MAANKPKGRRAALRGNLNKEQTALANIHEAPLAKGASLKDVEARLDTKFKLGRKIKREVLKDMLFIYMDKKLKEQATKDFNGSFQKYLQARFGQATSTAYEDVKILELLKTHKQGDILSMDKSDLIQSLRLILRIHEPSEQKTFLKKFEEVTQEQIKGWLESAKPLAEKPHYDKVKGFKQVSMKLDAVKGYLHIKSKDPKKLEQTAHLLRLLNDQNLETVIDFLEGK